MIRSTHGEHVLLCAGLYGVCMYKLPDMYFPARSKVIHQHKLNRYLLLKTPILCG